MRKAIIALAGLAARSQSPAWRQTGRSIDQLINAGWTCFRIHGRREWCAATGHHGRPSPTDPNPPPTFNFKIFTLDGAFVGPFT